MNLLRTEGILSAFRIVGILPALLFPPIVHAFGPRNFPPPPYALRTSITVSASEELIPNRILLSNETLETNPSLTTDGALRYVPGFSLFRRTGSRTSNPTTQGVSLRGIGASGASRALVLLDGVPLNDPFGGWVYWNRLPVSVLHEIEVYRGGASDLYGADALSGAIHFQRAGLNDSSTAIDAIAGNQRTSLASIARDQNLDNGFQIRVAGQHFHSDGDFLVEEQNRGAVDTRAGSEHTAAEIQLQKKWEAGSLFLTNSYYSESRNNGTGLQTNDTGLWQVAAGGEFFTVSRGEMWFRIYGGGQSYDQTFSAISVARDSESLVREQHVPSQHFGLTFHWHRQFGGRHSLHSGIAIREVEGESQEKISATGGSVFQGGKERTSGWFVQDRIVFNQRFTITLGSRFDFWQKLQGHSHVMDPSGATRQTEFDDSDEWQWSPRLALQVDLSDSVALVTSGYRSFRAPTLNELYRAFRVGNVLTLANEDLTPERLSGVESGLKYEHRHGNVHANVFWNRVNDPVTNLTLQVTPELITRQRTNVGRTTTRGLELEAKLNTGAGNFDAAYQFARSQFAKAADPTLHGNFLPQVPEHAGSFSYRNKFQGEWDLYLRARAATSSYDDDRNELLLRGYWLGDLFVSRNLYRSIDVTFAVENIFNERIVVSRTPIPTVGTSRMITVGIRFRQ